MTLGCVKSNKKSHIDVIEAGTQSEDDVMR